MSYKTLVLIIALSITLLTGCGGGGGGGNPVAPAADPLTDYPTIAASYVSMQTALVDNAGDETTRINTFMTSIDPAFKNIAGEAGKFDDLKAVTLSRLERYNFNAHSITPISHTVVDANTVIVVTNFLVNVVKKAGKTGSAPENTNIYLNNISITWKLVGGVWKVNTGFPYTSTEYWNLND